ncbi:MAG TPA: hypothetical protein VNS60_14630 [Solirubrobacterales bacterium]|nr:hypothetical protein [Solirubrobacterales bacterium]
MSELKALDNAIYGAIAASDTPALDDRSNRSHKWLHIGAYPHAFLIAIVCGITTKAL